MHVQQSLRGLRVAVPYIRAYKGRVFVVKIGGRLCEPGGALDNVIDQLAILYQLGMRLVVVHGGGPQADALSQRLGAKPRIVAGRRITDAAALDAVKMAFAGTVNTDVVAAFRKAQVPAIGLRALDGGIVTARKRQVQPVADPSTGDTQTIDFGFVGDIVQIRPEPLRHLLDGNYVPVVAPLAADAGDQVLNVNADTIAAGLAVELGAAKYFLITGVDGVLLDPADPTTLQPFLDIEQLDELRRRGVVRGGMLPKLAACEDALRGGVPRVHIINGTTRDSLLGEVFTNEGCGTLLVRQREPAGLAQEVQVER